MTDAYNSPPDPDAIRTTIYDFSDFSFGAEGRAPLSPDVAAALDALTAQVLERSKRAPILGVDRDLDGNLLHYYDGAE